MARTSSPDGGCEGAVDVHFGTEATFFTPTGALPGQFLHSTRTSGKRFKLSKLA